jgi:DNA polymerase III alpha subunit
MGCFASRDEWQRTLGSLAKSKDNFLLVVLKRTSLSSQEIYRQIESCGLLFCKAHSASYAVESYQSLYLKVYPVEFMVAVINNQGGFTEQKCMCMRLNVRRYHQYPVSIKRI